MADNRQDSTTASEPPSAVPDQTTLSLGQQSPQKITPCCIPSSSKVGHPDLFHADLRDQTGLVSLADLLKFPDVLWSELQIDALIGRVKEILRGLDCRVGPSRSSAERVSLPSWDNASYNIPAGEVRFDETNLRWRLGDVWPPAEELRRRLAQLANPPPTGSGDEAKHPPSWWAEPVGDRQEFAKQEVEQPRPSVAYGTGAPGRPSSVHFIKAEMERRAARGEMNTTALAREAQALAAWLHAVHPNAPQVKPKTLQNVLRAKWRTLGGG